jgi:hypothetical protein
MLTLNVVPERSLGCEQWEFIVGGFPFFVIIFIAPILFVAIFIEGRDAPLDDAPKLFYFT